MRVGGQAAEEGAAEREDDDVAGERERITSGGARGDSLCLRNLRKVYEGHPPKVMSQQHYFGKTQTPKGIWQVYRYWTLQVRIFQWNPVAI